MIYEFTCDPCVEYSRVCDDAGIPSDEGMPPLVYTVSAPMSEGPTVPLCPLHGQTRRVYGDFQTTVYHSKAYDYMDMAYRGETQVPGMSTAQVRAIVDKSTEHIRKGRANSARTLKAKTLR